MTQIVTNEQKNVDRQTFGPWRQGILLAVSLAAGLGFLIGLWLFARPLALVGLGIVIGEALSPLVDWGSRGLPRPLAAALLYVCIGAVLITIIWFALAPLAGQAQELLDSLPALIEQAETWLQRQDDRVGGVPIVDALGSQIQGFAQQLFAVPMAFVASLFDILLVVFLSLYWLLASPKFGHFFCSLFPIQRRERVREVTAELSRTVGGYVRGVGINVLVITIVSYIGLRFIGLPFALVFAVLAGLLEIIPIVGSFIAGVIIVGFALSQSLQTAVITLIFVIVLQQLEGNVLTPMVMRSQTDVHPFLILVAVVIGGGVGGILGVLVAIPLAGALKVLVVDVLAPSLWQRDALDDSPSTNAEPTPAQEQP
jgi:predicted PurR-regulated permease PerM